MRKYLALVTILSLAARAAATEWEALGPRAAAMGGAGVAVPQGAQSAYWNPAQLGLSDNPSGVQIPASGHMGITGDMLKGANDVNQLNKDCTAANANCNQANVNNALNELNTPNSGVRGDVGLGAGFKIGRASFFANDFAYVGAKPVIDMVHNQANNGALGITNNTSSLQLRGINVTEFGMAYGHEVPGLTGLHAGLALKAMAGRVGFQSQSIVASDNSNGGLGNFSKNTQSSVQPGVDVGMLWDLDKTLANAPWRPRIGLTARNVNDPKFKYSAAAVAAGMPSKYSLQGNVRMGLAVSPLRFWNIAADADLTKNLTAVDGVKSQQIGLGTEVNVFNRTWLNIPLRAGLAKNTADSSAGTMLTGGVGLNFLHFNIDLGAQVSPKSQVTQTQGKTQKLPTDVSVSAQFALLFGGQASEPGLAETARKNPNQNAKSNAPKK